METVRNISYNTFTTTGLANYASSTTAPYSGYDPFIYPLSIDDQAPFEGKYNCINIANWFLEKESMTLEKLQVIIDAQIQPLQKELNKMRTEISNATKDVVSKTSRIKSAFSGMAKFLATLAIGATFIKIGKSSLNMAREVEASTQQVNRLMGESAQAFMRWGKASALAFNLSQSDVMNFGAIYGNLLTSFISSTSGVAKYTTELLKASSIIASGTGRTMEDVMERIRSGLLGNTEAIEDLGINVNVAMLESTDAFKRFAGDNSWNQLDFQTQQQIRLFAILEQT